MFYSRLLAAGVSAAFLIIAGCASAVDTEEVQQKANPVTEMHAELAKARERENIKPDWTTYEEALVRARKENKFVMVDFYTGWCKWCKKLDTDTYADPAVAEALKAGYIPVKIDAESDRKVVHEMRQVTMAELAKDYGVRGYPAIWFLTPDGSRAKLLEGYLPADAFKLYLEYVKSGKYKDMEFEQYVSGAEKS